MLPGVAPLTGVALVAAGAAMWGSDGALRAPLVSHWSPWTIVLYEHIILTVLVAPRRVGGAAAIARIPRRGWLAVLGVAWGGSALATLAFTFAFQYGNPDVVILLQKTQPLWALAAAALALGERPRAWLVPVAAAALAGTYLLSFGALAPAHAFAGAQGRAAPLAPVARALWGARRGVGQFLAVLRLDASWCGASIGSGALPRWPRGPRRPVSARELQDLCGHSKRGEVAADAAEACAHGVD